MVTDTQLLINQGLFTLFLSCMLSFHQLLSSFHLILLLLCQLVSIVGVIQRGNFLFYFGGSKSLHQANLDPTWFNKMNLFLNLIAVPS